MFVRTDNGSLVNMLCVHTISLPTTQHEGDVVAYIGAERIPLVHASRMAALRWVTFVTRAIARSAHLDRPGALFVAGCDDTYINLLSLGHIESPPASGRILGHMPTGQTCKLAEGHPDGVGDLLRMLADVLHSGGHMILTPEFSAAEPVAET